MVTGPAMKNIKEHPLIINLIHAKLFICNPETLFCSLDFMFIQNDANTKKSILVHLKSSDSIQNLSHWSQNCLENSDLELESLFHMWVQSSSELHVAQNKLSADALNLFTVKQDHVYGAERSSKVTTKRMTCAYQNN